MPRTSQRRLVKRSVGAANASGVHSLLHVPGRTRLTGGKIRVGIPNLVAPKTLSSTVSRQSRSSKDAATRVLRGSPRASAEERPAVAAYGTSMDCSKKGSKKFSSLAPPNMSLEDVLKRNEDAMEALNCGKVEESHTLLEEALHAAESGVRWIQTEDHCSDISQPLPHEGKDKNVQLEAWLLAYAVSLSNMGCQLRRENKLDDALACLLAAQDVEKQVCERPCCSTMMNLSTVLLDKGLVEDALPIAQDCVVSSQDGEGVLFITALHNLAITLGQHSRERERAAALPTMLRALREAQQHLGAEHVTTLRLKGLCEKSHEWICERQKSIPDTALQLPQLTKETTPPLGQAQHALSQAFTHSASLVGSAAAHQSASQSSDALSNFTTHKRSSKVVPPVYLPPLANTAPVKTPSTMLPTNTSPPLLYGSSLSQRARQALSTLSFGEPAFHFMHRPGVNARESRNITCCRLSLPCEATAAGAQRLSGILSKNALSDEMTKAASSAAPPTALEGKEIDACMPNALSDNMTPQPPVCVSLPCVTLGNERRSSIQWPEREGSSVCPPHLNSAMSSTCDDASINAVGSSLVAIGDAMESTSAHPSGNQSGVSQVVALRGPSETTAVDDSSARGPRGHYVKMCHSARPAYLRFALPEDPLRAIAPPPAEGGAATDNERAELAREAPRVDQVPLTSAPLTRAAVRQVGSQRSSQMANKRDDLASHYNTPSLSIKAVFEATKDGVSDAPPEHAATASTKLSRFVANSALRANDIPHEQARKDLLEAEIEEEERFRVLQLQRQMEEKRERDWQAALNSILERTRNRAVQRIQARWRRWWREVGWARRETQKHRLRERARRLHEKFMSAPQTVTTVKTLLHYRSSVPVALVSSALKWLKQTQGVRYLARHHLSHTKLKESDVHRLVAKMQALWRGAQARARVCHLLEARIAIKKNAETRVFAQEQREYAAFVLQRQFRSVLAKKRLAELHFAKFNLPCRRIQGWFRALLASHRARGVDSVTMLKKEKAAITMQRAWRRFQRRVRYYVKQLRRDIDALRLLDKDASMRLQSVPRAPIAYLCEGGQDNRSRMPLHKDVPQSPHGNSARDSCIYAKGDVHAQRILPLVVPRTRYEEECLERAPHIAQIHDSEREAFYVPLYLVPTASRHRQEWINATRYNPGDEERQRTAALIMEHDRQEKMIDAMARQRSALLIQRAFRSWLRMRDNPQRDRRLLLQSHALYQKREAAYAQERRLFEDARRRAIRRFGDVALPMRESHQTARAEWRAALLEEKEKKEFKGAAVAIAATISIANYRRDDSTRDLQAQNPVFGTFPPVS